VVIGPVDLGWSVSFDEINQNAVSVAIAQSHDGIRRQSTSDHWHARREIYACELLDLSMAGGRCLAAMREVVGNLEDGRSPARRILDDWQENAERILGYALLRQVASDVGARMRWSLAP
jgi:hypothetical protein